MSLRTSSERRETAEVREVALAIAELFVAFLRGVWFVSVMSKVGRFWTAVASDCGSSSGMAREAVQALVGKLGTWWEKFETRM